VVDYSSTALYDTLAKMPIQSKGLNGYCTNINLNNNKS